MEGWVRTQDACDKTWRKRWMVVHHAREDTTEFTRPFNTSVISFYNSQYSTGMPPISMKNITQAYAVNHEPHEYVNPSVPLKLRGTFGDEDGARRMKGSEGWL